MGTKRLICNTWFFGRLQQGWGTGRTWSPSRPGAPRSSDSARPGASPAASRSSTSPGAPLRPGTPGGPGRPGSPTRPGAPTECGSQMYWQSSDGAETGSHVSSHRKSRLLTPEVTHAHTGRHVSSHRKSRWPTPEDVSSHRKSRLLTPEVTLAHSSQAAQLQSQNTVRVVLTAGWAWSAGWRQRVAHQGNQSPQQQHSTQYPNLHTPHTVSCSQSPGA